MGARAGSSPHSPGFYGPVDTQERLGPPTGLSIHFDPPNRAWETDPAARLAFVAEDRGRRILAYEPEMRAVLRLSLEVAGADGPELPMNRGLRIGWIEDALAPLRGQLPEDELRRLVSGIGATLGIEAFIWLTDIAKVSRGDAIAIMGVNALSLLRAAVPETDRS